MGDSYKPIKKWTKKSKKRKSTLSKKHSKPSHKTVKVDKMGKHSKKRRRTKRRRNTKKRRKKRKRNTKKRRKQRGGDYDIKAGDTKCIWYSNINKVKVDKGKNVCDSDSELINNKGIANEIYPIGMAYSWGTFPYHDKTVDYSIGERTEYIPSIFEDLVVVNKEYVEILNKRQSKLRDPKWVEIYIVIHEKESRTVTKHPDRKSDNMRWALMKHPKCKIMKSDKERYDIKVNNLKWDDDMYVKFVGIDEMNIKWGKKHVTLPVGTFWGKPLEEDDTNPNISPEFESKYESKTEYNNYDEGKYEQGGGMATLAEAYGGSNLSTVTTNVSNGMEGMSSDNPYGTNDRSSFSSKVGGEHEKQLEANKKQTEANKATKKGQVGGMATLAEAYGGTATGFETVTTGVMSGMGSILEGNTGKGVAVPQYKGAPGANKNIVKAAKLGEQTKENRKYDTIQKGGGGGKNKKRKHKGGCGCQERF